MHVSWSSSPLLDIAVRRVQAQQRSGLDAAFAQVGDIVAGQINWRTSSCLTALTAAEALANHIVSTDRPASKIGAKHCYRNSWYKQRAGNSRAREELG